MMYYYTRFYLYEFVVNMTFLASSCCVCHHHDCWRQWASHLYTCDQQLLCLPSLWLLEAVGKSSVHVRQKEMKRALKLTCSDISWSILVFRYWKSYYN